MDIKNEQNDKKKESIEMLKTIFDEVIVENSESNNLIEDYKHFIKFLDEKKSEAFTLNRDEINKFISIDEKNWRFLSCDVKAIKNSQEKICRYEISFFLENTYDKRKVKIVKTFFREIHRFIYLNCELACFTKESLKTRFDEISKVHDIYITKRFPNGKRKKQFLTEIYFGLDISGFEIDINFKYEDISLQTIELKDIYNIPEKITGKNLNKKLGLYTNMSEDDFNNFIYYETNERKIFLNELTTLFGQKNYIGICGPFGTGKTITLLKFLIESEFNRVLYINLWTIENTSSIEIKKLLKYESIKLFGLNFYNEKIKCGDSAKKIFEEIVQNIEDFNEKKIYLCY